MRARVCVFSSRSPFMFHSFSIRSFRVFSPRPFRVCSLFVPHPFSTCPPFVLRFILHLFSIRSPFVFHPPYVCFSFVVIYFTLILHFPLIRFFIRFFFIYLPFIFHLFSISVPFYFPVLGESRHSFTKPNMVRARSRLNTVLSRDQFSARISAKPTNGCQGETQSFPGKTLHVRLGSEIRELQLSK